MWRTSGELTKTGNVSIGRGTISISSHPYSEWRGGPTQDLRADKVVHRTIVNLVVTKKVVVNMVFIVGR